MTSVPTKEGEAERRVPIADQAVMGTEMKVYPVYPGLIGLRAASFPEKV